MNDSLFAPADELIRSAGSVLVLAHASPDGDCIGCALGLRQALMSLGKTAAAYCEDPVPPTLAFLPGADQLHSGDALAALLAPGAPPFDLVIVVDTGDPKLLGAGYAAHQATIRRLPMLTFDHHKSNSRYGDYNIVIDSYGSCGEVLTRFFLDQGYKLDADTATCLLAGIISDTNHFRIPDTSAHSFSCAAQLLNLGARMIEINENLMVLDTVAGARLKARALSGLRTDYDGKIAWLAFEPDEIGNAVAAENKLSSSLASYLRSLQGVRIGVSFLVQADGVMKLSFRGRAGTNVVIVANELGGGGHTTAAGATLSGVSLEAAVRLVIPRLAEINAAHFAT